MLSELGNFTPVSHILTREVGLVCAAVYGAVWRYCQMPEGICRASLNTIGADLGIDRATVMRSIDKLCKLGYLVDQTPARRNAPHTYILGKSVAECNSSESETVAESNSQSQTVAHDNATVAECNATVAESYLNRVLEDTSLRDNNRERESRARIKPERVLKDHKEIALKLISLCGYVDPKFVVNGKLKECADSVLQLIEWAVTPELLGQNEFGVYWWGTGPPTFKQVVENWGKFLEWRQRPKEAGKEKTNGQSTAGHRQTYKTKQNGRPLDPRAMDTTAIEREIADLERKLGARQNRPDLSPG